MYTIKKEKGLYSVYKIIKKEVKKKHLKVLCEYVEEWVLLSQSKDEAYAIGLVDVLML